jgi:hypothetical protein
MPSYIHKISALGVMLSAEQGHRVKAIGRGIPYSMPHALEIPRLSSVG